MLGLEATAFVVNPAVGGHNPVAAPPPVAPSRASPQVGANTFSAGALLGVPALLGAAAGVSTRRRARRVARHAQAHDDAEEGASRRSVAAAGFSLAAALSNGKAAHARKVDVGNECNVCKGGGLIVCGTCNGTGQFRILNTNSSDGKMSMQYQFYDCPECRALGELCCPACYATGLPNRELKGFLRNPDYIEATQFIKNVGVSPENLPEYQKLIKMGFARVEAKRAAKKAEKEAAAAGTSGV
mmetsp:Transcript_10769/g.24602  ORF Transcript_10769/g.24602 Transcript_10769/m.24602 type:complete len:242 (+) Transcript_10769:97-822(+)